MALQWYLCQQPEAKSSRYWDTKHSMPDNKNVFSARGWSRAHHHLLRPVWCRAAHASISPGSAPVEQQAPGRAVPVWLSHVFQVWNRIHMHRLAAAERAMRCKATWRGWLPLGGDLWVSSRAAFAAHHQFFHTLRWVRRQHPGRLHGSLSPAHGTLLLLPCSGLAWPCLRWELELHFGSAYNSTSFTSWFIALSLL